MGYRFFRYHKQDVTTGNLNLLLPTGKDYFVYQGATQSLAIEYATNKTYISGGAITGDDLKLLANTVDSQPAITLNGASYFAFAWASGTGMRLYNGGTWAANISEDGTDLTIEAKNSNDNISLIPAGAGLVKFGTYNATGDVACNGYISIKDSGGTTRKLMTTA